MTYRSPTLVSTNSMPASSIDLRNPRFDMTVATTMLATMATPTETGSLIFAERLPVIGLVLLGLLGWHWTTRNSNLELVFEQLPVWLRALIISAVVMTITFSGGGAQHAFIYFQF